MILTDIHCHNVPQDGRRFILDCGLSIPIGVQYASVGIHPWHISNDWERDMRIVEAAAALPTVKAIGECGIDFAKSSATADVQETVLRRHITLSESVGKPLVLHIVKGQEIVMRMRKELRPLQPWIVHGFRGKPEQARQYIAAGFFLSFGKRFNTEALLATPLDRILLESDEDSAPLTEHYARVADILSLSIEELAMLIERNFLFLVFDVITL